MKSLDLPGNIVDWLGRGFVMVFNKCVSGLTVTLCNAALSLLELV